MCVFRVCCVRAFSNIEQFPGAIWDISMQEPQSLIDLEGVKFPDGELISSGIFEFSLCFACGSRAFSSIEQFLGVIWDISGVGFCAPYRLSWRKIY